VRRHWRLLREQLPCTAYEYRTRLVEGEIAFLEWAARCPTSRVEDGADSFLIRGGRIVAQTIHYTVVPLRPARRSACRPRGRARGDRRR
jgi:hypothetical protein